MNDLTPHQKAILFTGLMTTMVDHFTEFTRAQLNEMISLSKANRELFMKELNKDESAEVVMSLARMLCE